MTCTGTALAFGYPGTAEMLVILVAVLLLFGARRLPGIARSLGKALEEFRRAAREVSDEIMKGDAPPPRRDERADAPPPGDGETDSDHEPTA